MIGYSIGNWKDEDGDGRFDLLEVETRNFKGPRNLEATGLPLASRQPDRGEGAHPARQVRQGSLAQRDHRHRQRLHAPWTITKKYIREQGKVIWNEDECGENNNHVVIGKENYFLSADGLLMPTKKNQAAAGFAIFPVRRGISACRGYSLITFSEDAAYLRIYGLSRGARLEARSQRMRRSSRILRCPRSSNNDDDPEFRSALYEPVIADLRACWKKTVRSCPDHCA